MAVWHAGNTISNIISGFLAAGILEHMGGVARLYRYDVFFARFLEHVLYISSSFIDQSPTAGNGSLLSKVQSASLSV
jgi:hypothetical protein